MKFYGYVRVSSKTQNDERQRVALLEFGVPSANIFADKLSGKDLNRPEYQELRKKLKKDDILVVKSLDRLGRSYEDIILEWKYITIEKKADIVVLDMPLLDTRQNKDLLGTFISDLVLGLLSYVSQIERELIKQRQLEGIEIAKKRGTKFGRPKLEYPENFDVIFNKYQNRELSKGKSAKELRISVEKFDLLIKRKHQQEYRKR